MDARGKPCTVYKHANEGMQAERPPIEYWDVALVLEEPDHDDGRRASRRIQDRTILVYYEELDDEIRIRGVSATRSHVPP